jgi:hypothetical protein
VAFIALFFALSGGALAGGQAILSGSPAAGDLTGTYPNPTIGVGKVTNTKLADGAVTRGKLADPTDLYEATNQNLTALSADPARVTVLTLNVPAGKYALNATTQVINGTPNDDGFDCALVDGNANTDISKSGAGIQSGFDGLLTLEGALTATSADTITMQCEDENGGNNESAADPSINAIRVDAINP